MKLAIALKQLASDLQDLGYSFSVVGGLAASVHGEARFTRDIDVAVAVADDENAEQLLFALGSKGYVVATTVEQDAVGRLATARLESPSGVVCDLVFSTCGFEHEIVQDASPIEIFEDVKLPTASPESIVAMKVLSMTEARIRDKGDILAILKANPALDSSRVSELLQMSTKRGYHRGQDLAKKWASFQ